MLGRAPWRLKIPFQIHNPVQTRVLMDQLYDRQMSNVADVDCFSQVVFESVEHYKRMKEDPYYKLHLFNDHENFADTQRSQYVCLSPREHVGTDDN